MKYKRLCKYLFIVMLLAYPFSLFAENIDAANDGSKYAYGENIGWINFKPSQGPGVTVAGTGVTGYAWSENIGWINFAPAFGGVTINPTTGVLGGYAWGENVGWINFAPTGGGVFIDACGDFNGMAWGENIGWISFRSDGANPFYLRTSWVSPVDKVPPVTNLTLPVQEWYNTNVTITLSATDCGTGVQEVHYSINGGSEFIASGSTASINVTNEGCHALSYYSIDNATPANVEVSNQVAFCIDKTPPSITIATPPDGATYYLNMSVTPVYTVSDAGSGVLSSAATSINTATTGSKPFTVSATDKAGNTNSLTYNYTVIADANPPVISIITPPNGATYYLHDAVLANYSVIDSETGVASIAADAAVGAPINTSTAGSHSFTVSATDMAGNTRSVTNTYTVGFSGNIDPSNNGSQYAWGENVGWINLKPSWGPGITVTDTVVTGYMWGENIGWIKLNPANAGVFNDGAGNLSGYAWGENVGWIKFAHAYGGVRINAATGVFSGYAWGENIGWINFGPTGRAVVTSWRPPNLPPVASDQSVTTNEDTPLSITLAATDPEGKPLAFNVVSGPSYGALSGTAPNLIYSPNTNYNGQDSFTFKANDGNLDSNVATVTITVNPVNDPPALIPIGNKATNEGELLEFTVAATDPDGDALAYSASNLPTGATFDPGTGRFTWTPGFDQAGSYPNVLFTATDNGSPPLSASEEITITVGNVNRPPILNPVGNKTVDEGQLLEITITATDPDGDVLTYSASNLPAGSSFNPVNQKFTWTPDFTQAANYDLLFTVTDNGTHPMSTSETITITVGNVNRPPVLARIGDKTISEGQLLQFTITATDPDGDPLAYSASNLPSGATFDPITQTFSWSPTYDQAGNYPEVRFTVTDSGIPPASASEAITITVGNVNRPPALASIGNKTANEGELLEFTITATDPDGDVLTYSASNLPAGAIFDPGIQKFRWIPTYDQAGTYSNIQFTATDNGSPNELDFDVIEIIVGNVNRAPVFTPLGTQSILENQLLQFYVTATDPDGNAFTYSAGLLPNGASFDASGRLFSWRPDSAQAGTYAVAFYATDNGSPPTTGRLDVVINVGDVLTPCQLAGQIIQAALSLNLPKSVENSYMANLKKVCRFVEEGKIAPAINQLQAFINKVRTDITKGNISEVTGNNLINMATNLINLIKS